MRMAVMLILVDGLATVAKDLKKAEGFGNQLTELTLYRPQHC